MNAAELARWRSKLDFAEAVWNKNGLGKEGDREKTLRYLDSYRGDQWKSIGYMNGLDVESHLVVNSIFSTMNVLQSQLMARNPKCNAFPKKQEAADSASMAESLINYYIDELKLRRQWNRALRDAFLMPFGVVRHGYTPPDELFEPKRARALDRHTMSRHDAPWMRRIAPWDIRIDPLAETFESDGDARWCAFRSLCTLEEWRLNPAVNHPDDLRATYAINTDGAKLESNPEHGEILEVWSVYDKQEHKWFQLSPGSSKLLRDPEDWPIQWEGLPYDILIFNEQQDTPFGVSYAEQLWPLQCERNKTRTIMNELVKRIRRLIVLNKSAFSEDEAEKVRDSDLSEILMATGDVSGAIAQIPLGGLPQDLLLYDSAIKEDMREIVGQSNMARAQRINVETASEANRVALGEDIATSRNEDTVQNWLQDSVRNFVAGVRTVTTEEVLVPILGSADAQRLISAKGEPFLRVSPEVIAGEYQWTLVVGSSLPRQRADEIRERMAQLQIAQQYPQLCNLPYLLGRTFLAMDEDPTRAMVSPESMMQNEEGLQQRGISQFGGQGAEAGGNVNPAAFLQQMPGGAN